MQHEDLYQQVNHFRDELISCAREMIRIPSVSGREGPLVAYLAEKMEALGFDLVKTDAMGNLIGKIGSGRTKIMIDAHLDTVGPGNMNEWTCDPYEGKLEKGIIYGRGATDQKLAMASMLYAVKLIKDLALAGDYTLYVIGSVEEENCEGFNLEHLMEHEGIVPDYVVLTEPTGLKIHRGQRGRMKIKITTQGHSCHASTPERGDNAVVRMSQIIQEVEELNSRLADAPFLGKGSVAVTFIDCVTPSLNAIPGECSICLDRRLTMGETCGSAMAEARSLPGVKQYGAKVELYTHHATSWKGFPIDQKDFFPAWVLPEEHPLVTAALRAGELAMGERPAVDRWLFSTNGVATAGKRGIPTVGFGPSFGHFAHTVDEQVPVEHLLKAAIFYAVIPREILALRDDPKRFSRSSVYTRK